MWYPKKYCFGSFNIFWIFKRSKLIKVDGYLGNLSHNLRKVCSCMSSNTHDSTASSHSLIIPLLNLLRLSRWRISNTKVLTHKMLISVQVDFDGYDHVQTRLCSTLLHLVSDHPPLLKTMSRICVSVTKCPHSWIDFSFLHTHLQAHVYTEKSSQPWDISQWTTQKCCITSRYYILVLFCFFTWGLVPFNWNNNYYACSLFGHLSPSNKSETTKTQLVMFCS